MRSVRSIAIACLTFLTAWNARAAAGDEAELARSARLETILRVALERNRDVAESEARARASDARSQAASRLPDLEAKYEQWGVPLARPYALNEANTLMFGVRQTFPAWGTLASNWLRLLLPASMYRLLGLAAGAPPAPRTAWPVGAMPS